MKLLTSLLLLLLPAGAFAQGPTPSDWGLKEFRIEDPELGSIRFYVTTAGIDRPKPLVYLWAASGGLPTMIVARSPTRSVQLGTINPDMLKILSNSFHVAYIGRAGTPFCDTVSVAEIKPMEILETYQPSDEYKQKCDLEWHLRASSIVVDSLCSSLPLSGGKVIALGVSEGGGPLARLAVENRRITHLVCIASCGLNELYSSIINKRIDEARGEITHQKAQADVDSLFNIYQDIYRDPRSTEKSWYGHSYRRWGSFASNIPLEHLVKLEIPILFVNGSVDRSTPILQSDYVRLEFLRLGKTNLTYRVLPGCDHQLYEVVVEDGKERPVSHQKESFAFVSDWIMAH